MTSFVHKIQIQCKCPPNPIVRTVNLGGEIATAVGLVAVAVVVVTVPKVKPDAVLELNLKPPVSLAGVPNVNVWLVADEFALSSCFAAV